MILLWRETGFFQIQTRWIGFAGSSNSIIGLALGRGRFHQGGRDDILVFSLSLDKKHGKEVGYQSTL
jgi:hypothetical protein